MKYSKLKELKKHISNVNFDYIEQEKCADYRENSGEYAALKWLRYWVGLPRETREVAQPRDVVSSLLLHSHRLNKRQIDYIYTLLPYC